MSVGMLMSGMLRLTNMPMPTPFLVLMEVGVLVEVWLLVPVGVLMDVSTNAPHPSSPNESKPRTFVKMLVLRA